MMLMISRRRLAAWWLGSLALLCPVYLACAPLSTGFNLFAASLYWSTFLHVAPTSLVAAAASGQKRSFWHAYLLWIGLTALFTVKFLSGMELAMVTIAAATLPLLVLYSVDALSWRQISHKSAAVLAAGICGFCVALLVFDYAHRKEFGAGGLDHLVARSVTWGLRPPMSPQENLIQSLKVLIVNFIDVSGYGLPVGIGVAVGILASLYTAWALRTGLSEGADRVVLVVAAAFLASASWVMFQPNHLLFHPRYATLLTAFPFGIFLTAAIPRLRLERGERA